MTVGMDGMNAIDCWRVGMNVNDCWDGWDECE